MIVKLLKLVKYLVRYEHLKFRYQSWLQKLYDDHMISTNQN